MDDTISRQAAIDYVDDVPYIKDHPVIGLLWRAWLKQLPSAQPGIIQCKDCKKWHTNCVAVGGKHGCDVLNDFTKPDDYCSWAERRTNE